MAQTKTKLTQHVESIRSFNRYYSQVMGAIGQNLYDSPFSMTEARVMHEVFEQGATTSRHLCQELSMDPGYLSRILHKLEEQNLIEKTTSQEDGRQRNVELTPTGLEIYKKWARAINEKIETLISHLPSADIHTMIAAMKTIEGTLKGPARKPQSAPNLRPHKPGDMGLIIHNHAVQFAKDYGWNDEFEALVAEKTCQFIRNFDPKYERCWIADMDGEIAGSVFVVKNTQDTGELRLLFVAPNMRGRGIGEKLLSEALRFAAHVGYKKLVMWTESMPDHAAKIFTDAGFTLAKETPHQRFGKDTIGQEWVLPL